MKNYEPEKRYEHTHQDTKGRTYRYDAKINYEEHHHDPEVEILGSKIDAMQTEMKMIREEIGLMKPLEEKEKGSNNSQNDRRNTERPGRWPKNNIQQTG